MKKKNLIIGVLAIGATVMLSGCSTAGVYLLNSGLKIGADHQVDKNIEFGQQDWQKLDVYRPANNPGDKKPVLVFFYGGSWDSGRKEMYYFIADAFARRGYVVVIPDYVKYPKARFPMFIEDGAAAIAWTKNHIADYGGDPDNVFISGHSAGAHLGALLLTDESFLQKHQLSPLDINGFVGLAGPYNFTPESRTLVKIFGPEENFPKMKTMNFVNGNEPPMLLLHGAKDTTVGVRNQEVLIEKLNQVGNPSTGRLYPGLSHVGIVASIAPPLRRNTTTLADMDSFFKAQLAP